MQSSLSLYMIEFFYNKNRFLEIKQTEDNTNNANMKNKQIELTHYSLCEPFVSLPLR